MSDGVRRGRRAAVEAARDREWLRWIGRFRFVTAELLGWRFGVSVQQANARVRRLAEAGLVRRGAGTVGQAYAVALTRAGARAVGLPERRAPRTDAQRQHELAIVRAVVEIERGVEGRHPVTIHTERECRQRQALGLGCYALRMAGSPAELRWPDLVVEGPGLRNALELEFAPKAPARLWRILRAYVGTQYTQAKFLVISPAVARSTARFISHYGRPRVDPGSGRDWCLLSVEPWPYAPPDIQEAVRAAIAEPGQLSRRERRR